MNIEDIILMVIIAIAAIYTLRRIYLVLFSKTPPKCSCCSKSNCCNISENTSESDHD